MLSNTATPRYYGEFRDQVIHGKIPVCREISLEMNRIDRLIEDPRFYYDDEAVEGWISFCEDELTLTDGSPLFLMPSFKLWSEAIYGWYYFIERSVYVPYDDGRSGGHYVTKRLKRRLVNKQYIITSRGSAKTVYAACHQAYGLVCDTSTTHQVTTAPTMIQAEEMLAPIKTAIAKSRGPLFSFLTEGSLQNTTGSAANRKKLTPSKRGIENFLTNSYLEVRALSIDKLQGLQNKYSTLDEWLSGDLKEDVIGTLEQGASKVDDYLIIAISSEGTMRNGVGDSIKMDLMSILRGDYYDPHTSIWWYKLDDLSEINNPALWAKACPNIGMTVSYDTYQREVEKAEHSPSSRNDILAKRFGIPCEGYTYFFTYQETLPHRRQEFWNMSCSLGIDLSQGGDFCSFTFLFPLAGECFGVKAINYITDRTMDRLPTAMRLKYDEFVREGSLVVMEGTILDINLVYDDLDRKIQDRSYDVCCVGYDPYNAKEFINRWSQENGPFGVEKVIQGAKTETVPLTEMKKLAEDRKLIFDERIVSYTMGNAVVIEDTNGNKKLMKKRYETKIDVVSAMMDALVSYKLHKDAFG